MIDLARDGRDFLHPLLAGIASAGWGLERIPDGGRLPTNRLPVVLRRPNAEDRFRILAYSIGESGRSRPGERRVEITSTYEGGRLTPLPGFQDVVVGYDLDTNTFVGLDPRRLSHGGPTENASTFISLRGIDVAKTRPRLYVLMRPSALFGQEYQAYGEPLLFPEYLLNLKLIHRRGLSAGRSVRGRRGRRRRLRVPNSQAAGSDVIFYTNAPEVDSTAPRRADVLAYEDGGEERLRRRKIDPASFADIKKRCDENGELGEDLVMKKEQERLKRAGRNDLANKVDWVSRDSIGEGYDILSFEPDGTPRYIEVKSTEGSGRAFMMSANEWRVAEFHGERYHVARVTEVRGTGAVEYLTDPCQLERDGRLTRAAAGGWKIELPRGGRA
jgi:hypothetical protein